MYLVGVLVSSGNCNGLAGTPGTACSERMV